MLALLGWHTSDNRELFGIEELIQLFSIEKISKNGAKFDPEKAKWFNHQHLMLKANEVLAQDILPQITAKGYTTTLDYVEKVIGLMKEKVTFKSEIADKSDYFFAAPKQYDEQVIAKKWTVQASDFLKQFAEILLQNETANSVDLEVMLNKWKPIQEA